MAIWYSRNEKIHNTIIMRNYETHMRNYTRWETQYIKIQIEIKKSNTIWLKIIYFEMEMFILKEINIQNRYKLTSIQYKWKLNKTNKKQ